MMPNRAVEHGNPSFPLPPLCGLKKKNPCSNAGLILRQRHNGRFTVDNSGARQRVSETERQKEKRKRHASRCRMYTYTKIDKRREQEKEEEEEEGDEGSRTKSELKHQLPF